MQHTNSRIRIYTDGSCVPNPGDGGAAAIVLYTDDDIDGIYFTHSASDTTNNRMEIMAAIIGLEHLPLASAVTIFTDSTYLINILNTDKPKINLDLLERLKQVCQRHDVLWVKVKAHSGDRYNEAADALANFARLYKDSH